MISGTSHDGIDVAIVNFVSNSQRIAAEIEYTDSVPYSLELRSRLSAALPPAPIDFEEVCQLDMAIGQAFGAVAAEAIAAHASNGHDPVDAVCSHGQTLFHWVEANRARGTLQLGHPAWIAEATGLPLVSDLRMSDLAAGGHGAPLVPILDRILLAPFGASGRISGALNLGGISNLTVAAPGRDLAAWDIGPANALIDAVVAASEEVDGAFDRDGALAGSGTVIPALLSVLLAEPYYALPAPKSSGKELFHLRYVDEAVHRAGIRAPSLADLVSTLTQLTAITVAEAVHAAGVQVLVASGGGVRNPVLMTRLLRLLPDVELLSTDDLGVPSDEKEAVAFALIGWATIHGLPGNVPSATGASGPRVMGRISPAPSGRMPTAVPFHGWPEVLFTQRKEVVA